jgi:hypothetical protein
MLKEPRSPEHTAVGDDFNGESPTFRWIGFFLLTPDETGLFWTVSGLW